MGNINAVSSTALASTIVNKFRTTRVAVDVFGDSNMGQDTGGHWSSWAILLKDRVGIWGHGVYHDGYGGFGADTRGLGSVGGNPSGIGLIKKVNATDNSTIYNKSMFTHDEFVLSINTNGNVPATPSGETPVGWSRYWYVASTGQLIPYNGNVNGTAIINIGVEDGANKLFDDGTMMDTKVFHSVYLRTSGFPIFHSAVRGQNGGVGSYATTLYTPNNTITTSGTVVNYSITMVATTGAERQERQFQYNRIGVNQSLGEFYAGPAQWVKATQESGVAVSPVYAAGGRTLRNIVHDMRFALAARPESLKEQLRLSVRAQTPGSETVVLVNKMKGNDVGDGNNSWVYGGGTATQTGAASNTKDGYKNNLNTFIRLWYDAWEALGYDTNNLFFIDGAYHPQPNGSYTVTQGLMQDGAVELAEDGNAWTRNLLVIKGNSLITASEMTSLDWYKPADTAHLSTAGFDGFNALELDSLFEAADYVSPSTLARQYKISSVWKFGGGFLKF